jgi:hypothetical protein
MLDIERFDGWSEVLFLGVSAELVESFFSKGDFFFGGGGRFRLLIPI